MKQVAVDFASKSRNLGTAHVYKWSSLNAILTFSGSGCLSFGKYNSGGWSIWNCIVLDGCSWNTVSKISSHVARGLIDMLSIGSALCAAHLFHRIYRYAGGPSVEHWMRGYEEGIARLFAVGWLLCHEVRRVVHSPIFLLQGLPFLSIWLAALRT